MFAKFYYTFFELEEIGTDVLLKMQGWNKHLV